MFYAFLYLIIFINSTDFPSSLVTVQYATLDLDSTSELVRKGHIASSVPTKILHYMRELIAAECKLFGATTNFPKEGNLKWWVYYFFTMFKEKIKLFL